MTLANSYMGTADFLDISEHEAWFSTYVDSFLDGGEWVRENGVEWSEADVQNIETKRNHSFRVLEQARLIAAELNFAPELHRAVLLAALYHDVGRFAQYARYRTFADRKSVNHGFLGSRILKAEKCLKGESGWTRKLVRGAVVLHNRLRLPDVVPEELKTVAAVVRDSDKLDIIPVIVADFRAQENGNGVISMHTKYEPEKWSQPVLDALMERRLGIYEDMVYQNDFKLLVCTWVFDLNFPYSLRVLRESGGMESVMALWPADPRLEPAKAIVREALAS